MPVRARILYTGQGWMLPPCDACHSLPTHSHSLLSALIPRYRSSLFSARPSTRFPNPSSLHSLFLTPFIEISSLFAHLPYLGYHTLVTPHTFNWNGARPSPPVSAILHSYRTRLPRCTPQLHRSASIHTAQKHSRSPIVWPHRVLVLVPVQYR